MMVRKANQPRNTTQWQGFGEKENTISRPNKLEWVSTEMTPVLQELRMIRELLEKIDKKMR